MPTQSPPLESTSPGFITGVGLLFGAIYFVQSIGDPASGLIAQPVRSLLNGWGQSPATIAVFMAIMALPWSLKPLLALLSDFVPLFGSRRRSYLILATAIAALGLTVLYVSPLLPDQRWLLLTLWFAAYAALLLSGVIGGYLTATAQHELAFLLCAMLWTLSLLLTVLFVRERRSAVGQQNVRATASALRAALAVPGLATICAITFIWDFNPLWVSVLYLHVTDTLGMSEQVYGNGYSLFSAGAMAASVAYGVYCRRVRTAALLHACIVADRQLDPAGSGCRSCDADLPHWWLAGAQKASGGP